MRETRQIQRHHVSYSPERTILIFKAEHMILTWLNRMTKPPSWAFMNQVEKWAEKSHSNWIDPDEMIKLRVEQNVRRLKRLQRKRKRLKK